MTRFRPTFWPTVFVVPALALLIGLGTWQMERRVEKAELLARIDRGLSAEPAALPAEVGDPAAWDWRRAVVEGRFDHAHELHLVGRTRNGAIGEHIVTPLIRPEGPPLLVDRGWVPLDRTEPATRPDGLVEGPVRVEGVLRLPTGQAWMQPDNDPARNTWFWIDLPEMGRAAGLGAVAPLILQAAPEPDPSRLPAGVAPRIDIPNDHLQYALTWYGFAVILVVIYVAYHLRRPDPDA